MKKSILLLAAVFAAVAAFVFAAGGFGAATNAANEAHEPTSSNESNAAAPPRKTLRAFGSEQELKDYFRELAAKRKRDEARRRSDSMTGGNTAQAPAAEQKSSADDKAESESVTNTQHAGVDEGGIVKLHGEHLVILRRGRLFTVKIGDDDLKPVSAVDAYAPGVNPSNDWYDEMLISGDTVVVIGYSYGRGGTEINLFDISDAGGLQYRSTHHLRSNDYYSSRNYASRLIGNKLVFYTPQYLGYDLENPLRQFPALRKWRRGATDKEFQTIVHPTRVYRSPRPVESSYGLALHTVTVCDLANSGFSCQATGVIGAPGRVFYVSPGSVYVWTTDWNYDSNRAKANSMLYKMPLDGSAPSAMGVAGSPVDQFSFLESDNHLNVLVRSDGAGEQMWGSEFAAGDVALFRTSLESFSDGTESASNSKYRELPKPEGYTFQNRFVSDYLLYGTGSGWGRPEQKDESKLYAVRFAEGEVNTLRLEHGVDRIEAMGKDAVVVGTNGRDLYFSPVRLNSIPSLRESYRRRNASQGELRSHGFFYKPDGSEAGWLGLPVRGGARPGYEHLRRDSASILFLRNDRLDFNELGELESKSTGSPNDGCRASCVDWYGNARPLFIRNRVFALLGYEIVEGNLSANTIRESRRINYAPQKLRRLIRLNSN